jgi:ABC-type multidrug transport system ATPase subunit
MMYTLRRLADSGRTVLVTHATANISQCDHVAFMSDGRLVYWPAGRGAAVLPGQQRRLADIYTKLEGHGQPARPRSLGGGAARLAG